MSATQAIRTVGNELPLDFIGRTAAGRCGGDHVARRLQAFELRQAHQPGARLQPRRSGDQPRARRGSTAHRSCRPSGGGHGSSPSTRCPPTLAPTARASARRNAAETPSSRPMTGPDGGLMRAHEPEDPFESARSPGRTRPRLFTGSRVPPSAAGSHGGASRAPRARRWSDRPCACRGHDRPAGPLRIHWALGSNSRDSSSGVRPAWTRSTSCCRNSGGYGCRDLGIVDSFRHKTQVSTKPGQLQYDVEAYGIPWTRK